VRAKQPVGLENPNILGRKRRVCRFTPEAHHTAYPGIVYGGLIASLIDCNSIATAMAISYAAEGRKPGTDPEILFFTANLNVSYLEKTPLDAELAVHSRLAEQKGRKVVVASSLYAGGRECARGEVIAVRASAL
jgi:acyl-coenzyme A thioesterase PaaI-like protein